MRNDTFWNACARYCSELAPVVGPLLSASADLATAIDRAALKPATSTPALPKSKSNPD
jgi:hypothetical protein